jgi:hypothetical protein
MKSFRWITNIVAKVTKVHPLFYLLGYLLAIPIYAFLYMLFAAHDFYAPYAKYEPGANQDRIHLARAILAALHQSFTARAGQKFVAGNWKLEPDSVKVFNVDSIDGAQVTFTISLQAHGLGQVTGARTYNWSVKVTVPDHPIMRTFKNLNFDNPVTYRFPVADLQQYVPSAGEETAQMFGVVFGQSAPNIPVPALALGADEDSRFERFLRGFRGDSGSVGGQVGRMVYFSAVVITTLGLGDIIPMTTTARTLVAIETMSGIALAGFFLNALAYRATKVSQ